ncbi:hypothetical protein ACFQO1_11410 [Jejudonia soesokkakensis]|uniref:Uncharacterized protein n=1 Tax=Jejudonia soesokkakensis TaxID=1323432 RepID=A0ABW2MWN6_9FLAO
MKTRLNTIALVLLSICSITAQTGNNWEIAPVNPSVESDYNSKLVKGKYAIISYDIYNEDGSKWGTNSGKIHDPYTLEEAKAKKSIFKKLDSKGQLIEMRTYWGDTEKITTYTYNSKGLLTNQKSPTYNYDYEYDSQGRVSKYVFTNFDRNETSIKTYTYKKEGGLLKVIEETTGTGYFQPYYESHYKDGLQVFTKKDKNSPGFTHIYTYDDRGNWITHQYDANPGTYTGKIDRTITYWDEITNPNAKFEVISKIISPDYGDMTAPYVFLNGEKIIIPTDKATGDTFIFYVPQTKTHYAAVDAYSKSKNTLNYKHDVIKLASNSEVVLFRNNGYFNLIENGKLVSGEKNYSNAYGTLIYHLEGTDTTYIIPEYSDETKRGVPGYLKKGPSLFYLRDVASDKYHLVENGNFVDYSKIDGNWRFLENGDPVISVDGKPTYILSGYYDAKNNAVMQAKKYTSEKIKETTKKDPSTTKVVYNPNKPALIKNEGEGKYSVSQEGQKISDIRPVLVTDTRSVYVGFPDTNTILYSTAIDSKPVNGEDTMFKVGDNISVIALFDLNGGFSYMTPQGLLEQNDYVYTPNEDRTATIFLKATNTYFTGTTLAPEDVDHVLLFAGKGNSKPIAPSEEDTCTTGDCTNGYGSAKTSNGQSYSGRFVNGTLNGPGYRDYGTGNYRGEFKNNVRDGFGKYNFEGDNNYYVGYWKNGNYDGYGYYVKDNKVVTVAIYENGKVKTPVGKAYLDGTSTQQGCTGDCKNGYGSIKYTSNDSYFGYWKNGTYSPMGAYYYSNGDSYYGNFDSNGKRSGFGFYFWKDGGHYNGNWANGTKHGYGIYTSSTGSIQEGNWVNGELKN